jgi:imidazolonepropionase-like amidohydrolase
MTVGSMILSGGFVFDGTGSAPFRADVRVENGKIADIGTGLKSDERVDATGRTILPGLIDCHSHVALADVPGLEEAISRTPTYDALRAIAGLHATLGAGVTTVRDAAGADAGLRRALEEGLILGPRLLVSLMQLSPSAGPYDMRTPSGLDLWANRPGIPRPLADGAEGVRAKVREFVQAGADVIKIFATGNFAMPRGGARRQLFGDDELRAIVEEAGAQGILVMAHAHGAAAAAAAARAGVASIEHGFFLDDAALEAMLEHGTVLVPTLLASAALLEAAATETEEEATRLRSVAEGHRAVVREAHRRGVTIAMGTDCPVAAHGRNLEELALLTECGLTAREALLAATSTAARLLGLEGEIGTVERGKRADLVMVVGDALEIATLPQRIDSVYRDGARVPPVKQAC